MKTYIGIVTEGAHIGTNLGFPTANIALNDKDISGIYAGEVVYGGKTYNAALYANQKRNILEAHLLDFSGTLYGETVTITVWEKIRDDGSFSDVEALKAQIAEDIKAVRAYALRLKKAE